MIVTEIEPTSESDRLALAQAESLANSLVVDLQGGGDLSSIWDTGAAAEALRIFQSSETTEGLLVLPRGAGEVSPLPFDLSGQFRVGGRPGMIGTLRMESEGLRADLRVTRAEGPPDGAPVPNPDRVEPIRGLQGAQDQPSQLRGFYGRFMSVVRERLCDPESELRQSVEDAISQGTKPLLVALLSALASAGLSLGFGAVVLLAPIAARLIIAGIDALCEIDEEASL